MSRDRENPFARADEFMQLFRKGAEFSKEILAENERLRKQLAELEAAQEEAARCPKEWEKLRQQLLARVENLEEECETVRERLAQVEEENRDFAQRYVEVEEENNSLANLYIASYQLHSSLDLDEVLKVIIEIVINLIGADVFAVYLLDEKAGELGVAASEGADSAGFPACSLGSGLLGKAIEAGRPTCWNDVEPGDLTRPLVCIPLVVDARPIGAIAIFSLLQQKDGFSPLDHELFSVLGGHAATALMAARLYSQSERKLNTIQGFIDLLTK